MKRRLEKIEAAIPREGDEERRKMIREMSEDELRAIIKRGCPPGWRDHYRPDCEMGFSLLDMSDEAILALTRGGG